jgi:hypothetical protein
MQIQNELQILRSQENAQALTDGLTGIASRRAFDEALVREWKRTLRASLLRCLDTVERCECPRACFWRRITRCTKQSAKAEIG